MGSDGSNPRRLTHHSAWDGSPSFSPDGRYIVFDSGRDGKIYAMELREEDGEIASTDGLDGSRLYNLAFAGGGSGPLGKRNG